MRLATDTFAITHGSLAVRLRPSLRAALHLQRAHDFRTIFANIIDGHLGTIADVLVSTADDSTLARRIFDRRLQEHVGGAIAYFQATLLPLLAVTFGMDGDETADAKPSATITLEQSLTNLFEIGTGCLGWTPADTWAATPGEIVAAHRGLIAKLKAIHGSADDKDAPASTVYSAERLREIEEQGFDPAFDRDAFRALAAQVQRGGQ